MLTRDRSASLLKSPSATMAPGCNPARIVESCGSARAESDRAPFTER